VKGMIFVSKATDEFIMAKCEEVLGKDREYQKLDREILEAEKSIRAKFTNDIGDFLKYERLIIDQLTLSNIKIYNYVQAVSKL
jgi:hypothetical protein